MVFLKIEEEKNLRYRTTTINLGEEWENFFGGNNCGSGSGGKEEGRGRGQGGRQGEGARNMRTSQLVYWIGLEANAVKIIIVFFVRQILEEQLSFLIISLTK